MIYTLRISLIAVCMSGLSLWARQAPTAPAKPLRVAAPTREPHTEGYVKAKKLPDGMLPTAKQNGNFIIGPTHEANSATTAKEGVPKGQVMEFTMDSKDSKIYPGVAREGGRPAADPNDSTKPRRRRPGHSVHPVNVSRHRINHLRDRSATRYIEVTNVTRGSRKRI